MAARLGNVFYWFGLIVAVITVIVSVGWNVTTIFDRTQMTTSVAEFTSGHQCKSLVYNDDAPDPYDSFAPANCSSPEGFGWGDWLGSDLVLSLLVSGVLLVLGLFVFGLGWALRYVLSGPKPIR